MMNAIVRTEQPAKMMLLAYMADKYSLNPDEFSRTVRKTCGLPTATAEEFAAFLIVAKEYNPQSSHQGDPRISRPRWRIVPIVSIDGWVNLVNSHRACDGFEFEMEHDDSGKLISCTCRMFRKDRTHPVAVTEYLSECIRGTEPRKMQHRMLRHKAMIQAARLCLRLLLIYDEDEGEKIANAGVVRDDPPAPPALTTQTTVTTVTTDIPKAIAAPVLSADVPSAAADPEAFVRFAQVKINEAATGEALGRFGTTPSNPVRGDLFPSDVDDLMSVYRKRETALNG